MDQHSDRLSCELSYHRNSRTQKQRRDCSRSQPRQHWSAITPRGHLSNVSWVSLSVGDKTLTEPGELDHDHGAEGALAHHFNNDPGMTALDAFDTMILRKRDVHDWQREEG